jgi:hypothetical protein
MNVYLRDFNSPGVASRVRVVPNRAVPESSGGEAMIGFAVVLLFVVAVFVGMTWLME